MYCRQASGKAGRQGRKVWVGASGVCMTTPFSSATSQFIMRNQQAFRHDTIGSMFVQRTVITSPIVRYSVAATPAGRLCNTMTRKRRRIWLRKALHIPVTVLYTPQLLLISLRTRISLRGGRTGHRPSAQFVTGRYLNMVTNLHIAVEACWAKPSRAGPPLRTRIAQARLFLFGSGR